MYYKVYICKPLPRPSYFGTDQNVLKKFKNVGGKKELIESKPLGSIKRLNSQTGTSLTDTIRPILNTSNNLYDIGLGELIDNFTYERNPDDIIANYNLDPNQWRTPLERIVKMPQITKQTWGEIRFGLNYDELTQRRPPKATKDNPDPRTRIMKTSVILYDEAQPFSEDNLEGWLKIQVLKSRTDRVAQDEKSANPGVQAWLLIEQAVEQRQTLEVTQLQNRAIAKFAFISENYPVTNALEENIIYFIGTLCHTQESKPLLKGKMNPISINEKFDEYLKPKDKGLIRHNCETFLNVVELFEKNPDSFYAKTLARQAHQTSVVQNNNGRWYWVSKMKDFKNVGLSEFTSYEAFTAFVQSEMLLLDSPVFKELIKEVEDKNGIVASSLKREAVIKEKKSK